MIHTAPKLSYDHDGFTYPMSKKFHFSPDCTSLHVRMKGLSVGGIGGFGHVCVVKKNGFEVLIVHVGALGGWGEGCREGFEEEH